MRLTILNIDRLLDNYAKAFYTEPLMILLNIFFLVLSFKYGMKEKKYRLFTFYGMTALVQRIIITASVLTQNFSHESIQKGFSVVDICTMFFIQIEFYIFYKFFYLQFEGKSIQRTIGLISRLFLIISVISSLFFIIFSSLNGIRGYMGILSVFASILLLIPAFYYFYTLFSDPPLKNLLREPPFWKTNGIAFLHGLNISLFLVEYYLLHRDIPIWSSLYTVNYIAYCFLFILFIISLLCNKSWGHSIPHQRASIHLNKIL